MYVDNGYIESVWGIILCSIYSMAKVYVLEIWVVLNDLLLFT